MVAKVEWEGGVLEAMDWIDSASIEDPLLAERWSIIEGLWLVLRPLVDELDAELQEEEVEDE